MRRHQPRHPHPVSLPTTGSILPIKNTLIALRLIIMTLQPSINGPLNHPLPVRPIILPLQLPTRFLAVVLQMPLSSLPSKEVTSTGVTKAMGQVISRISHKPWVLGDLQTGNITRAILQPTLPPVLPFLQPMLQSLLRPGIMNSPSHPPLRRLHPRLPRRYLPSQVPSNTRSLTGLHPRLRLAPTALSTCEKTHECIHCQMSFSLLPLSTKEKGPPRPAHRLQSAPTV